jgi:CheY-like chemotaxis protein
MDQKPTLLLVDDCQTTLTMMRYLFESAGAVVHTAVSGLDAIAMMDQSKKDSQAPRFDMVVLDIRMPHMHGDELAKILRNKGFTGKIVALTANATGLGREQSLQAGIDMYLGKSSMKKEVALALVAGEASRIAKTCA